MAQRAAVAALGPEAKVELAAHVRKYAANRQVHSKYTKCRKYSSPTGRVWPIVTEQEAIEGMPAYYH